MHALSTRSWLLAGAVLIALSQMRWGIAPLAWIAPVPFMAVLRAHAGWRARAWTAVAVYGGFVAATLKIVTPPIPAVAAFGFALPPALLAMVALLAWDRARQTQPVWAPPLAFAAATVVTEQVQHRLTPFGSWGAIAYTQVDVLSLLQISAVVGMAGVSFLVTWVAAALETRRALGVSGPLGAAVAATVVATGWGLIRLGNASSSDATIVAAVGTDATVGGFPYPSAEELAPVTDALVERTRAAAARGAALVAWTEAATLILPQDEADFQERLSRTAKELHIELVAAYIVPDDDQQVFHNQYVWLRPDGTVHHVYNKHNPVPGEPSVRGDEPFLPVDTAAGRATGAICYDYDFPALALAQARLGLDLAVIPSSDWRGIDPIHTQMASLRAIEGGFSLLRSTRMGMTAAYDRWGRALAWESSFEATDRIVLAAVPRGAPTFYRSIGDAFVGACAVFLAWAMRSRRNAPDKVPARA